MPINPFADYTTHGRNFFIMQKSVCKILCVWINSAFSFIVFDLVHPVLLPRWLHNTETLSELLVFSEGIHTGDRPLQRAKNAELWCFFIVFSLINVFRDGDLRRIGAPVTSF